MATFTGPKLGERLKEIYSELPIQDRERWGLRLSEMDKGDSYRHELGPYRILADSGVKGHLARMVSYDLSRANPVWCGFTIWMFGNRLRTSRSLID